MRLPDGARCCASVPPPAPVPMMMTSYRELDMVDLDDGGWLPRGARLGLLRRGAEGLGSGGDGRRQQDDVLQEEAVRGVRGGERAGRREEEREGGEEGPDRQGAADRRDAGRERADGDQDRREDLDRA